MTVDYVTILGAYGAGNFSYIVFSLNHLNLSLFF